MNKKLWAGRFTKKTHPDVEQYTASIQFDSELAYEDILGSLAHASMLAKSGIISLEEKQELQRGLQLIAKKLQAGEVSFRVEDEDIHMNIERLLRELIGETAGKLHTARSRNDQVALDIHLYLRQKIVLIVQWLVQLQETLVQIAKEHHQTILPGYTHLQRAQPIYLAQHLLAYASMFQRDSERLQDSWPRVNRSPLGACALTGTTFAIDKQYVASALGFDGVYINTLDAVSDRDFVVEFLATSSIIMMHISRLSEELILWSSQEFNFIQFDDAFCTGSSIMPQKKNPDVVELGRAKTGRVYGALLTLLTILKGLPLAYNKDLQEDKEPLFDVIKTLCQTLSIYSPLLTSMKINTENMRKAVEEGHLNATVLAEYLVKNGMIFRSAHEVVGKLVAYCLQKQRKLEDLSLEEMQQFAPALTQEVYENIAIDRAVLACNRDIEMEFSLHEQQIQSQQKWIAEKNTLLAAVYAKFDM